MNLRLSLLAILAILSTTLTAQENQKLLIKNVDVIPMHVNTVWENRDVVVKDGVIVRVSKHNYQDTSTYDLGVVDGTGKFLLPSFSDAHCHFPEKEHLENYFLMHLANGVTTLRSMRGEEWHLDIDKEDTFTPRLLLSSPPMTRGDTITNEEADALIKSYKEAGYDFVKVLSVKDQEIHNFLTDACTKYDFDLAGHCPRNIGIFNTNKSGVYKSYEHIGGFFQLPGTAEIIKAINETIDLGIYHCATLDWNYTSKVSYDELRARKGVEYLPESIIKAWEEEITQKLAATTESKRAETLDIRKQQYQSRLNYLGYIYRQGGLLLIGADASGPYGIPGYGTHTEMQHHADANISNYDILKSACYNLSAMNATQSEWGTIKENAVSDMVLLDKNPLDDIKNTEAIVGVIYKGKYYTQQELIEKLKETLKN